MRAFCRNKLTFSISPPSLSLFHEKLGTTSSFKTEQLAAWATKMQKVRTYRKWTIDDLAAQLASVFLVVFLVCACVFLGSWFVWFRPTNNVVVCYVLSDLVEHKGCCWRMLIHCDCFSLIFCRWQCSERVGWYPGRTHWRRWTGWGNERSPREEWWVSVAYFINKSTLDLFIARTTVRMMYVLCVAS